MATQPIRGGPMSLTLDRLLPRALIAIALAALSAGGVAWASGNPAIAHWVWAAGAVPVIGGLVVSIVRDLPRGPARSGRGRAPLHPRGRSHSARTSPQSSSRSCMLEATRSRNSRSPARSATSNQVGDIPVADVRFRRRQQKAKAPYAGIVRMATATQTAKAPTIRMADRF